MTHRFILPLLTAALLAGPALACGNGECEPPPPPPPPPPPVVVVPEVPRAPDDRDPAIATPVIHYGVCCSIDGKMYVTTGWLRDPVTAMQQCQAREERLQSLPECPRRLRDQEGGE